MFALTNPAAELESFDAASPQQAYRELAACPFTGSDGKKVLGKRADIVQFNRHPAVRASDGVHFPLGTTTPLIPLGLDGEEHRFFRALLDPLFTPKVVTLLEPKVRHHADRLIDAFIEDGEVELYGAFCEALPSTIFVSILGLPEGDTEHFLAFKDGVVRPQGNSTEELMEFAERAGDRMRDYLSKVLDDREAAGATGDDLIGGLLTASIEGRRLQRSEILNIVYLLVIAGLDTVASSLSCMIAWLAQHPDERAALVADPGRLPRAVEELLRTESPVMYGSRYVTEDFELNGWSFRAGEWVDVMWAAANNDDEAFADPLTVDLDRRRVAHLGFASGPHRCLGSNLARMELITVLDQFHRRIPEYRITPGREPAYTAHGVRAAIELPLSFAPSRRVNAADAGPDLGSPA
jgi:cytochrome P450